MRCLVACLAIAACAALTGCASWRLSAAPLSVRADACHEAHDCLVGFKVTLSHKL